MFEEIGIECVGWEYFLHRFQLSDPVNRVMKFWWKQDAKFFSQLYKKQLPKNVSASRSLLGRTFWDVQSTGGIHFLGHRWHVLYTKLIAADIYMWLCMQCVSNVYWPCWMTPEEYYSNFNGIIWNQHNLRSRSFPSPCDCVQFVRVANAHRLDWYTWVECTGFECDKTWTVCASAFWEY